MWNLRAFHGAAVLLTFVMMAACSSPTSPQPTVGETPLQTPTNTAVPVTPSPTSRYWYLTPTVPSTPLPPAGWNSPVRLRVLTANTSGPFSAESLKTWTRQPYQGQDYRLPINLEQTSNAEVTWQLTEAQQKALTRDGFFVMHSQEDTFETITGSVTSKGQALYISSDEAMHAFHMTFDYTLKALEREVFRPKMMQIIQATEGDVLSALDDSKGGPLEADMLKAAAYLGVAQKLFDPEATIDPRIEPLVTPQVEQVMAQRGIEVSTLFPDFEDDYGAYKPVGHYAGSPELESYFRGMSWLGRVHFALQDPEPNLDLKVIPSRVPLIITQAMRRAQVAGGGTAADEWAKMHETLTFLIGPSDDSGPAEYATLMDAVYGTEPRPADLADDAKWLEFRQKAQSELPSPRINSTFLNFISNLPADKGWRFMGQRFTLDANIFQQLMFDAVKKNDAGERRDLPTGPDIMAVLGSPVALNAVHEAGKDNFPNYQDQAAKLRQAVAAQPEDEWLGRFYDSWLYMFIPLVGPKDATYPTFMRGENWNYREMNSALANWAELKRDTILYNKMPEGGRGGGGCGLPTRQGPTWIEANPDVFYRMAYAARSLTSGLDQRGYDRPATSDTGLSNSGDPTVYSSLGAMNRLADTLELYGNVAVKELAGESLTDDEKDYLDYYCLICFEVEKLEPMPVVAAVAGANNPKGETGVLEAASGYADRMYAIVPYEGKLYVAQGGVFSYYEFVQPRDKRLTDDGWRNKLKTDPPPQPVWAAHFSYSGGAVSNPLVFKIGGIYGLTADGIGLNVREEPSTSAAVVTQLGDQPDLYLTITDGPVDADSHRWWKIEDSCYGRFQGWVQENPAWYYWSW